MSYSVHSHQDVCARKTISQYPLSKRKAELQTLKWNYILRVKFTQKCIADTAYFLCFFDRASRYNCVKRNQLDAQLILSIFRQPLHVSGVSRPIMRRYSRVFTTIGTYYSFWMTVCFPGSKQDKRQSSKKNNKYQLLYTYGCTSS